MECNRSQAERIKDLADEKFISGDLQAALKMALKAQSLFPSLPCLAQMLAAFNVHIAAATRRLPTGATDWHAVLGVGLSDDPTAIKKQFRRMCVLTHPDKNPSAAADGAFKLIMEAWAVLSNPPADAPAADSPAPPGPNTPPQQQKPYRPYYPPPPPAPTSGTFLCPHCFTAYDEHDAAGADPSVVRCNHCGKSANRKRTRFGTTTASPSSSQGKRSAGSQQPNTCSRDTKIRRAHYAAPPHPPPSAQPSVRRTVVCPTCGRTGKCLISGRSCVFRCRGDGGEEHLFTVSG